MTLHFEILRAVDDLEEGVIYTFSAQIKKKEGAYYISGCQLKEQSQPRIYQATSHVNCPPDNLAAQKWDRGEEKT